VTTRGVTALSTFITQVIYLPYGIQLLRSTKYRLILGYSLGEDQLPFLPTYLVRYTITIPSYILEARLDSRVKSQDKPVRDNYPDHLP